MYILQASGPPLTQLALDPLPVPTSPSLPLTTTRQCYLEGTMLNLDMVQPAMTAILWILSQWYAQRDNNYVYFSYASLLHTLSISEHRNYTAHLVCMGQSCLSDLVMHYNVHHNCSVL